MSEDHCPKCGHAPLSARAPDATCPACGVIVAKAIAARKTRTRATATADQADSSADRWNWSHLLLHVPEQVARLNWQARLAALAVFACWSVAILSAVDIRSGLVGSHLLWAVLTPFHEAGHYLIFRWFGGFIMILGGTLGQHLMPLTLAIAFLRRGDPFGAALFGWLFGFSLIMMAVYMYDAFDPQLTLLDGRTGADSDGHDWQNLFGDMGLLRHARGIGIFFGCVGRATMIASLVWAGWVVRLQYARLSDNPFAEDRHDA